MALGRYNESFLTEVTGGTATDSSAGSNERCRGQRQVLTKPKSVVFCHGRRVQYEDDRCSRTGGGTVNVTSSDLDEVSFSHRSQVGLLMGRSSSLDYDDDHDDDDDIFHHGQFLSSSFDGSLDDGYLNRGGTQHQDSNEWSELQNNGVDTFARGTKLSMALAFKGCVPSVMKKAKKAKKQRDKMKKESVRPMPSIPEGLNHSKYSNSFNVPEDEEEDFPDIIFANEEVDDTIHLDRVQDKGLPNIQPFSAYERRSSPSVHSFVPARNHSVKQTDQYGLVSPRTMPTSYQQEVQFLDTLANDLTLSPDYDKLQRSIQELTGKTQLERMVQQQQKLLYQMAHGNLTDVPNVVGFRTTDDQSDLVSEVGMASTSGGRYNDNASLMSYLGKIENKHQDADDHDDYGPPKAKNIPTYSARRDSLISHKQRFQMEKLPKSPADRLQEKENQGSYDGHEAGTTRNNFHQREDSQDTRHIRARSRGSSDGFTANSYKAIHQSHGKSLFDDSYSNDEDYHSTSGFDEPNAVGDETFEVDNRQSQNIRKQHELKYHVEAPTCSRRDTWERSRSPINRSFSPSPVRNNGDTIDQMPSPTRVGLKPRPKKADALDKWREGVRNQTANEPISSHSQHFIPDNSSDISSSSRFSRSSKYREVLGAPYKITKEDRGSSMGSIQTHKWSNTSAGMRQSYSNHLMSVHDETLSCLESSESSTESADYKIRSRNSPQSVIQYDGAQSTTEDVSYT